MRQTFGYASAVSFQPENFLTSKIMCGDVSQSSHETRLDLAAEVLHRFGEVRFVARGSSMIPSIYPGDMVTVSSEGVMDARCGEIVLCLVGGRFFVHRVMRKWAERHRIVFATRGDALAQEDPSVDGTQLLGQAGLNCPECGTPAARIHGRDVCVGEFGIRPRSPKFFWPRIRCARRFPAEAPLR